MYIMCTHTYTHHFQRIKEHGTWHKEREGNGLNPRLCDLTGVQPGWGCATTAGAVTPFLAMPRVCYVT